MSLWSPSLLQNFSSFGLVVWKLYKNYIAKWDDKKRTEI
jgi:hypothetical protein